MKNISQALFLATYRFIAIVKIIAPTHYKHNYFDNRYFFCCDY